MSEDPDFEWVAKVDGDVRVIFKDEFSRKEDLRVLPDGHEIFFEDGETFAIRGKIDGVGMGLHIVQADGDVRLTGPAVLDGRRWGVKRVDKIVEAQRTDKLVILASCVIPVIGLFALHRYVGQMLPAFLLMIALMIRIRWPREKPALLQGPEVKRHKPEI